MSDFLPSPLFALYDPLSQFEVTPLPLLHWSGLTNLALVSGLCVSLIGVALALYDARIWSTYDYTLQQIYGLVRSIAKENLHLSKQQYFTVLIYLFLVLLAANVAGMMPYSFTVTSSFAVTFFLALGHFIGINLIGVLQHGWGLLNLFLPSGAPLPIVPLLIVIELVSYIARVFSLSIRLFANMMSGHALLKILIGFSWTMFVSGSLLILFAVLPWAIVTAIMFLEFLIAFLQAYVFTILITLYLNDAVGLH